MPLSVRIVWILYGTAAIRAVRKAEAVTRFALLPLDDCLYALQPTIPRLTRSSLHRCLQRHGIGRLPDIEGDKEPKKRFKSYPIGFFHIDLAEAPENAGTKHLNLRRRWRDVSTNGSTPEIAAKGRPPFITFPRAALES